jgi:hypothetical protein
VARTDDSHRVAGDCRVDSVADDYSAADCPAEAGSPQDCSYPDAHSPVVDSPLADFQAGRSADCLDDFRLPEVVAAEPVAR